MPIIPGWLGGWLRGFRDPHQPPNRSRFGALGLNGNWLVFFLFHDLIVPISLPGSCVFSRGGCLFMIFLFLFFFFFFLLFFSFFFFFFFLFSFLLLLLLKLFLTWFHSGPCGFHEGANTSEFGSWSVISPAFFSAAAVPRHFTSRGEVLRGYFTLFKGANLLETGFVQWVEVVLFNG